MGRSLSGTLDSLIMGCKRASARSCYNRRVETLTRRQNSDANDHNFRHDYVPGQVCVHPQLIARSCPETLFQVRRIFAAPNDQLEEITLSASFAGSLEGSLLDNID